MRTQDVTPKTCRRRWMIGRNGERGSGISVLAAQHDDDDDYYYIFHHTVLLCIKVKRSVGEAPLLKLWLVGSAILFSLQWNPYYPGVVVHVTFQFMGQKDMSNIYLFIIYSSRVFHISISWWFFTRVWVTASLLKYPGLVSVFWPSWAML